ncbi:tyrosine-type recombinase/integrase [Anaerorhabdus sp.]|uniref:tyrosine-type recombinase/integrase n=1 Tax=Anaerorhabdus sp. TaxID=1872524 RepID=UPI002FC6B508
MAKKYKKRKDGRYSTSVFLGYNEDGKKVNKVVYGYSIQELEENKSQIIVKRASGLKMRKQGILFKTYAKNWFENKCKTIKPKSQLMYKTVLDNHCELINNLQLANITKADIKKVIDSVFDKPPTAEKVRITLNQVFNFAIDDDIIHKNPCKNVILPKKAKPTKRPLTDNEIALLSLTAFTDREQCLVTLLYHYGLRREEVLILEKNDFNFDNNTFSINHSVVYINNKAHIQEPKSYAGYRTFTILLSDQKFINYYVSNLPGNYLFTKLDSTDLITEQSFKCMFKQIINKMNAACNKLNKEFKEKNPESILLPYQEISGLTPHIFRHNYATDLYYAGVDVREAMQLLGHSTIAVTQEIYTHLEKENKNATNKYEQYLLTKNAPVN